jgi:ATP-dependent RNA helicase DBP3
VLACTAGGGYIAPYPMATDEEKKRLKKERKKARKAKKEAAAKAASEAAASAEQKREAPDDTEKPPAKKAKTDPSAPQDALSAQEKKKKKKEKKEKKKKKKDKANSKGEVPKQTAAGGDDGGSSAAAEAPLPAKQAAVTDDQKVLVTDSDGMDVTSSTAAMEWFSDADLQPELLQQIASLGFTKPTKIQKYAIPLCQDGKDVVAIAETGSGKTLAFMLPAISPGKIQRGVVSCLVLAPTRELAQQTQVVTSTVAPSVGANSVCVYGGDPKFTQIKQLKANGGANVVVATPGRLVDLAEDSCVDLSRCSYLVLDEADRMLDMGFEPQIKRIVSMLPAKRQTLMFSATWPPDVRKMAETYLTDAWQVRCARGSKRCSQFSLSPSLLMSDATPPPGCQDMTHRLAATLHAQISIGEKVDKLSANRSVTQIVHVAEERERWKLLQQYMNQWTGGPGKEGGVRIMLFMLYKKSCQRMHDDMCRAGWNCGCVHGDKAQSARTAAVEDFKSGRVPILICTDVAARGLDIKGVQYVINFEFPLLCEDWVHRVGRTGRAGAKGTALTLFGWEDRKHSRELKHILDQSGAQLSSEFNALVDKSPPWIKRKTNAERMFGRGSGDGDNRPMKKKTHVKF